MIPIVSFSHIVTIPFLLFISFRLFPSFFKTKDKNIGYFFATFAFLTIMEGLLASPGLIFKDSIEVGIVFAIYPFFLFLSLSFFAAVSFNIMKWEKTKRIFLIVMFIIAISITIINLINLQPAVTYQHPPFAYWEDTRGAAVNIFIGILSGLILMFIVFFYLFNGLKSLERYVRIRSFLIGGGTAGFFFSAIINFVSGSSLSASKYISSIMASFVLLLSCIIIFVGVRYKYKKEVEEFPYPKTKETYPKIKW